MKFRKNYNTAADRLEHDLRRAIYRRSLLPGEKLRSEQVLADEYDISRTTARKALGALARDGLIKRVRGGGTYVAEKIPAMRLHSFSPVARNRQILFLSLSTAFSEETLLGMHTFDPVFDGLGRVLKAFRRNLLIGHVDTTWTPPVCLKNGDVAGIIFHGRVSPEFRERYMKGIPCVGLQHFDPTLDCSWVCLDNYLRSWLAVRHLYELGHRKIAFFLRGCEPDSLEEARLHSFRLAMRSFDLPCPQKYILIAPSPRSHGERRPDHFMPDFFRTFRVFSTPERPTALIIQDNIPPVARALEKHGLRIPDDVSVITGFNGIFEGDPGETPTYVSDRFETVCEEGARLLIEHIGKKGSDFERRTILVRPELFPGNTTIPCRQ